MILFIIIVTFLRIFIKNSYALSLNHFSLFGKSNNFIFWKACLLVDPVGFDPRFNVTQGHNILAVQKTTCLFFKDKTS